MTHNRHWTTAGLLFASITGLATLAVAQTGASDTDAALTRLEGEEVLVSLEVWNTSPGGPKHRTGTASETAKVGERRQIYTSTTEGGCARGLGTGPGTPELRREAAHHWSVDASVVEASMDRIVLDVEWQRLDSGVPARTDRRTISLGEGESHVLDFHRYLGSGESQKCALSTVVELKASVVEDPQLRDARIRYDLWLSDETPRGERQNRHLVKVGGQGEQLLVEFDSLRWQLERDGWRADVVADVVAGIRGRLRRDGSLSLDFDATRWLGVTQAGEARKGGMGDGGKTIVNVVPGEPVRLILPTPRGVNIQTWGGDMEAFSDGKASGARDGLTVTATGARVELEPLFRDHTMSLILTATVE